MQVYQHEGGEPTLAQVAEAARSAREAGACWIAGVGGGSVLDLAKAAAGLAHAEQQPAFYQNGGALDAAGVPFIAVPTTAGTGAEATPNAVITNHETGVKKSIRDPSFLAALIVLDPELLAGMPKPVIAAAGMDALTQAVESFLSVKATWLSEQLALQGVRLLAANLAAVYDGETGPPLEACLLGSYLTGVAFSFSRLGVVHGLAHPLGAVFQVPHGLVCGVCLPHALAFNREAARAKYETLAACLGGDPVAVVREMLQRFDLRSPFAGAQLKARERIVREVLASGSTAANPRPVTAQDVDGFLTALFAEGAE